uniref:NADH dehydrogenase subunit 2 n=1 Tax=Ixodes trichosuri TaxID=262306 RepID=UPI001FF5A4DF|nr:NADH dehydrogenase subunit 2 [Ixodes trichosuri]UOK09891.1 NADH dehydrogenase subunit 2 [Ixodes trichosuri]
MNMLNMILFWILGMSIIMSFSTNSWFSFWISMEINMMVFIPLMNSKNFLSCNSMINYFIIQSLASSMFLISSILYHITSTLIYFYIIMLTILIKMASAPFHMWFPQISENISMKSFFLLSTFQKMIPLQILSNFNNQKIIIFIILSALIGTFGGFNQTSLRKILAFSSIAHLSWMMTLILINQHFWIIYFFLYSMIIMKIMIFMKMNFINLINNIHMKKMSEQNKLQLFSTFLSLAGLPPFLGFFMKMFSILIIINKIPWILLILIPSSLGNMYFYTRIMFPMIMFFNSIFKNYNNFSIKSLFFFFINTLIFMLIFPFIQML